MSILNRILVMRDYTDQSRYILPSEWYININKVVMPTVFFLPLTIIALFESQISHTHSQRLRILFSEPPPEEEGDPKIEDPACDDDDGEISTVKFDDLVKAFPKYVYLPATPSFALASDSLDHAPGDMAALGRQNEVDHGAETDLPDSTALTESAVILGEIRALKEKLSEMEKLLLSNATAGHTNGELVDVK